MTDYYKLLEIQKPFRPEDLKKSYKSLALRFHPDRHPEDNKIWAEDKFKLINEAYSILCDPIKRREYDLEMFRERMRSSVYDRAAGRTSSYSRSKHRESAKSSDRPKYEPFRARPRTDTSQKSESKTQRSYEYRSEPKPEAKPEPRPEVKPEAKVDDTVKSTQSRSSSDYSTDRSDVKFTDKPKRKTKSKTKKNSYKTATAETKTKVKAKKKTSSGTKRRSKINPKFDPRAKQFYEQGVAFYNLSQKKSLWRIIKGSVTDDLKQAKENLLVVITKHKKSIYLEHAYIYYFRTVSSLLEYDNNSIKEIKSNFKTFFIKFPISRFSDEARILYARFCMFRMNDYSSVNEILQKVLLLSHNKAYVSEAKSLLEVCYK